MLRNTWLTVFLLLLLAAPYICSAQEESAQTTASPSDTVQTLDADQVAITNHIAKADALWEEGKYWMSYNMYKSLATKNADENSRLLIQSGILKGKSWQLKFWVNRLVFLFVVCAISIGMFFAMRGVHFPLRNIPGMDALREAVGRATEMGRPSLFTTGVSDMHHPETFAAMPFLRKLGQMSAQLRNRLLIPVCSERTLTLQQITYREACQSIGEARAYQPSDVRFFPGGQFYYAVATMGYMLRERPAACFYFGYYEAESLMLSETGQVVGAMQIAGTPQLFQVPFFIAACDYVIIGEEYFAASATISDNPILRGSLFGQDIAKLLMLVVIAAGSILFTVAAFIGSDFEMTVESIIGMLTK